MPPFCTTKKNRLKPYKYEYEERGIRYFVGRLDGRCYYNIVVLFSLPVVLPPPKLNGTVPSAAPAATTPVV